MISSITRCSSRLHNASLYRNFSVQPDFQTDYIQTQSVGLAEIITIKRPQNFNSINKVMIQKILSVIRDVEKNKKLLIIKGNAASFSSGGDLKELLGNTPVNELIMMPSSNVTAYKYPEYQVFQFLKSYQIPYVALVDGIAMGAGLGLAMTGRYRIATERTMIAMPENKIGYFADVGSSYFLSRLPRNLGIYLGVTGASLKGSSVLKAGLATQYVNSQKLPELEASLLECTNYSEVETVLDGYAERVDKGKSVVDNMENIEKCFAPDTVENIIERLETVQNDWSRKVLKTIHTLSPASMKITLKMLERGAKLSYEQCLRMEYSVIINACDISYDIITGIREVIINKKQVSRWNPATLREVDDVYLEPFFRPLPPHKDLQFRSQP